MPMQSINYALLTYIYVQLLAGMVSEIIESIYKSTSAQSQHLVCSYIQIVTPIYSIECASI